MSRSSPAHRLKFNLPPDLPGILSAWPTGLFRLRSEKKLLLSIIPVVGDALEFICGVTACSVMDPRMLRMSKMFCHKSDPFF